MYWIREFCCWRGPGCFGSGPVVFFGGPFSKKVVDWLAPSGKHTKNYGKSQFFMGKLTISTGPFSMSQTANVITGQTDLHGLISMGFKMDPNMGNFIGFSGPQKCDSTVNGLNVYPVSFTWPAGRFPCFG